MPNYQVWYNKDPVLFMRTDEVTDFEYYYVPVMRLQGETLDSVYFAMQGENWSPNGEAQQVIRDLDLSHTSMMVGDVIEDLDSGKFFVVEEFGYRQIITP